MHRLVAGAAMLAILVAACGGTGAKGPVGRYVKLPMSLVWIFELWQSPEGVTYIRSYRPPPSDARLVCGCRGNPCNCSLGLGYGYSSVFRRSQHVPWQRLFRDGFVPEPRLIENALAHAKIRPKPAWARRADHPQIP